MQCEAEADMIVHLKEEIESLKLQQKTSKRLMSQLKARNSVFSSKNQQLIQQNETKVKNFESKSQSQSQSQLRQHENDTPNTNITAPIQSKNTENSANQQFITKNTATSNDPQQTTSHTSTPQPPQKQKHPPPPPPPIQRASLFDKLFGKNMTLPISIKVSKPITLKIKYKKQCYVGKFQPNSTLNQIIHHLQNQYAELMNEFNGGSIQCFEGGRKLKLQATLSENKLSEECKIKIMSKNSPPVSAFIFFIFLFLTGSKKFFCEKENKDGDKHTKKIKKKSNDKRKHTENDQTEQQNNQEEYLP